MRLGKQGWMQPSNCSTMESQILLQKIFSVAAKSCWLFAYHVAFVWMFLERRCLTTKFLITLPTNIICIKFVSNRYNVFEFIFISSFVLPPRIQKLLNVKFTWIKSFVTDMDTNILRLVVSCKYWGQHQMFNMVVGCKDNIFLNFSMIKLLVPLLYPTTKINCCRYMPKILKRKPFYRPDPME